MADEGATREEQWNQHRNRQAIECSYFVAVEIWEQGSSSYPQRRHFESHVPARAGGMTSYSVRNAVSGFTWVARRAGRKQAKSAAVASNRLELISANGSLGLT